MSQNNMGRSSIYTEELGEQICEKLATTNKGIHAVCKELGISAMSVFRWIPDKEKKIKDETFGDCYARARELQQDLLAEEILAISDDGTHDTMTVTMPNGDVKDVEDKEWTNRSRLRVDTRKFLMAKLAPKKYGDKIQVEQTIIEQPLFPDENTGKEEA
jgi:AcrR family transcriptional regulator